MTDSFRIAVVQSRIEHDIKANGAHIRGLLDKAAAKGAGLALFPEGALSGYAKAQVRDWADLNWKGLAHELDTIGAHADQLGLTAVIGAAGALPKRRPHNSLFVLPQGPRYDKRYLSNTEVNNWYTPGLAPAVFEQAGFAFGMSICIEAQFPEIFINYEALGVDCMLHATYGLGPVGDIILRGHAATNCLWLAVATPANADEEPSGIIGPDGMWLARCSAGVDLAVADLDRGELRFEIALTKARPWRRKARDGGIYRNAARE